MKKALITGITGQDGSYLAEHLVALGYEVHGTARRVAGADGRAARLARLKGVTIHQATLECEPSLRRVVRSVVPDECYHLAAQSAVPNSFADEFSTMNINVNGTHFLLQSILEEAPACRFYFAASSEMFGGLGQCPQTEQTPFHPRSPYGISKVSGFNLTRYYREAFKMFAVNGILFNHESPRRGEEFVTRKVAKAVAAIKQRRQKFVELGFLDAWRDWGYAPEYVQAMRLMLQQDQPDDYVIATNETHSVAEFVERAFAQVGIRDWRAKVKFSDGLVRPNEVANLKGDYGKAQRVLGWEPRVRFEELVVIMVEAELKAQPISA